MFGPLWFLSLEILYFGLCFNKNISFIQKKKKKKAEKGFEETYCWTAKPRRCGATIEDVAETYTYFSLQIRRINLEMRERHLSKIHSAYMIYLRATTSVVA